MPDNTKIIFILMVCVLFLLVFTAILTSHISKLQNMIPWYMSDPPKIKVKLISPDGQQGMVLEHQMTGLDFVTREVYWIVEDVQFDNATVQNPSDTGHKQ